jgi:hypothetical protein
LKKLSGFGRSRVKASGWFLVKIHVDIQNQSAAGIFDPSEVELDAIRSAVIRAGYTPKFEAIVDG